MDTKIGDWLVAHGCPPWLAVLLMVTAIVLALRALYYKGKPSKTEAVAAELARHSGELMAQQTQIIADLIHGVVKGNGDPTAPSLASIAAEQRRQGAQIDRIQRFGCDLRGEHWRRPGGLRPEGAAD